VELMAGNGIHWSTRKSIISPLASGV
jgi:hypothetical protein